MDKPKVGGRPLKYETPEDLAKVINKYFADTDNSEYSVTGLALMVGSKQLIQDYEKRAGYSAIVREAKLIVENSYELDLRKKGGAHNIFALKNFGWVDRQELAVSEKNSKEEADTLNKLKNKSKVINFTKLKKTAEN